MLNSNFWLYWRTMFAFENWHSALEMKLYIQRYHPPHRRSARLHGAALHQVQPVRVHDPAHGEVPRRSTACSSSSASRSTNVMFDMRARAARWPRSWCVSGTAGRRSWTSPRTTWCSSPTAPASRTPLWASQTTAPRSSTPRSGRAAAGRCGGTSPRRIPPSATRTSSAPNPGLTNWESATVTTLDDKIPPYLEKICKRDPFTGKVVTGGIVTVKDSAWLLSWTFNRQPHFKAQPEGQLVGWIYGLFTDVPGDYVKKPMRDVYRPGDLHGVAVPPGGAGGARSRPAGGAVCQHRPLHDALHHRLLHAPRPGGTGPTWCRRAA